jgi:hypothetical protein
MSGGVGGALSEFLEKAKSGIKDATLHAQELIKELTLQPSVFKLNEEYDFYSNDDRFNELIESLIKIKYLPGYLYWELGRKQNIDPIVQNVQEKVKEILTVIKRDIPQLEKSGATTKVVIGTRIDLLNQELLLLKQKTDEFKKIFGSPGSMSQSESLCGSLKNFDSTETNYLRLSEGQRAFANIIYKYLSTIQYEVIRRLERKKIKLSSLITDMNINLVFLSKENPKQMSELEINTALTNLIRMEGGGGGIGGKLQGKLTNLAAMSPGSVDLTNFNLTQKLELLNKMGGGDSGMGGPAGGGGGGGSSGMGGRRKEKKTRKRKSNGKRANKSRRR